MRLVEGKPVFLVCECVRLKPNCSPSETNYNIEIAYEASLTIHIKKVREHFLYKETT